MSELSSKLITSRMPWHANMTEMNHLGKALISKPHVFESVMRRLFSSYNYSENPLTKRLVETGRTESIDKDTWEWKLRGASTRPLVILENVEPSGVTQLGLGRQVFRMKFDQNWWKAGDIIHPGTSNKKYQCRIQKEPYKHGNGYIYEVRLMDDSFTAFVPIQYVNTNTQWAKLFAQYGEASKQSGSTQYALPITLMNRMSRYRKMYEVTGDAANDVLSVKIPDGRGNMYSSWIRYAEAEYWIQWYRELERGKWYSRSTETVLDEGRPIRSGPGIQEQLEDSHVYHYSTLTARLIEEYLMDIFYGRVKPGTQRQVEGFTGEYGMIQFHRAIEDWQRHKGTGFIQLVQFVEKEKSPYNTNAFSAGYQYVKYKMANGSTLSLTHQPLYDDREINFEIDPVTGFPVESQRITFMDFAGEGKSSNIVLMDKKNSFKLGYVHGLQTPYGPVNKGAMAHSGDWYEMHVQKQEGIHIEDVTRCGELILDRN